MPRKPERFLISIKRRAGKKGKEKRKETGKSWILNFHQRGGETKTRLEVLVLDPGGVGRVRYNDVVPGEGRESRD